MASTAAKVIWGESDNNNNTTTTDTTTTNEAIKMNNETQGQEPVSGKLGDTSKGEPFDAGNIGSLPPSPCESRTIIFVYEQMYNKS